MDWLRALRGPESNFHDRLLQTPEGYTAIAVGLTQCQMVEYNDASWVDRIGLGLMPSLDQTQAVNTLASLESKARKRSLEYLVSRFLP